MNKQIRNFCIIAHIDHGKSTLADRLLEFTNTVTQRDLKAQLLDDMDLERERGITIKNHAIQMEYTYNGSKYILNLIDTPGHVDFSYEVSRSIATCEGALLIVDASQGIQAQTISNLYLAIENDLEIIPVLNKVDLPNANVEEVKDEIVALLGCERASILEASAKTGLGVEAILHQIINKIPPPQGSATEPLQALIFDSFFNSYRGVIVYFRVVNGTIRRNDKIKFLATDKEYIAEEIGILKLTREKRQELAAGDVGYLIAGVKAAMEVKVGDTVTHSASPAARIDGFKEVKPLVFAGIYPSNNEDYEILKESMLKLQLNDASLTFQPESSVALGFGLRCGFLGMLHMEIIQERIEREFNLDVLTTVPNVSYRVRTTRGQELIVTNPSELPETSKIEYIEEPYIKATIISKSAFIGPLISLCMDKRGTLKSQNFLTTDRVELVFQIPMAEIVFDFYDKLKTISKGYASFDYEIVGYEKSDLVRLDIKINGNMVDALSLLIHRNSAYSIGKKLCEKLKELLPRQQFEIAIQAAIGAKIIARETVKALRKDVTSKCYGGDITRKRKLLEKQKKGKKRMRQIGNVEIPQSAFMSVLKLD